MVEPNLNNLPGMGWNSPSPRVITAYERNYIAHPAGRPQLCPRRPDSALNLKRKTRNSRTTNLPYNWSCWKGERKCSLPECKYCPEIRRSLALGGSIAVWGDRGGKKGITPHQNVTGNPSN